MVVLFCDEVQNGVNPLRDPGHWQPECGSIDEEERTWMTIAGSERKGALLWVADARPF
ncbi:hypothetical protein [Burkholderia sp. Bp9015]|uniref:hypothetical protein n=1 Tax=Burkholderia sp. Bp9015 TaxID=2184563 RepID=UPI0021AB32C9|nr:hypothetical protein [Burkholderia sp. Bp9015]